ncbi:MAG: FecR domain-containing protein [Bacteroidetes bacterium]|nr:FecR domain-containing protein [Bacteroidota bacterium]MCL6101571.1 FecR domain-containing protein [Bacteroidota bacterium]
MDNQKFKDIISRYFRGQLIDSEYELLTEFLQDIANREYLKKAKADWEQQPELDELGYQNLNRLNYHINSQKTISAQIPVLRRLWVQVASVAAILIFGLLLGSTFTYLTPKSKTLSEQLVFETPRGEKSLVKLPDGSEVWLNANSRLVYNSFSSNRRQVGLKGEAFFKVARNEKAPFVVKTDECEVEVLGTTFNIMAYNEFGREEITLLSGKVNVHTENAVHVLKPGQAMILKDHKSEVVDVDPYQASGWVENKFSFKNIPLSELIKRLENWYDIDITLENNTGKEINFTGTFKNEETIWQVLDAIKVYTPISYKKTDLRQIKITVLNRKAIQNVETN